MGVRYVLKGQELNLRPLPDPDFDEALRLMRFSDKSFDICPTCGQIKKKFEGWEESTYRHLGEEHPCDCSAQVALFARYLLANIGIHYMELDWKDFHGTEDARKWVLNYLADWRSFLAHGFGLTFASKYQGVGKTFAATHIGKELIKERQRVYFLDFVQMVEAFCGERERKSQIEQRMRETTFLIIDDVRAGISPRQNDLYAQQFEVVIRHRTSFNLPTIFTTNLTEEQFEAEFSRIYSLIHSKQMWISMNGADYRKKSKTGMETAEMIANKERRHKT